MGLEVQVYLHPRYLRERGWLSEAINPTRSIVAGSSHGVPFSKLALYPIPERVHQEAPPASFWTLIDDIVGRCEGTAQAVLLVMDKIGTTLARGLEEQRLAVSCKSLLLGSSTKLAKMSAKRLRARGDPVKPASQGVDLGLDVAAGRRTVCAKSFSRRLKSQRRAGRIKRLRRTAALGREARCLWATGAFPQAVYGHQVHGAPPSALLALRRQAAAAVAGGQGVRCLTSTLAASFCLTDVAVELRRQQASKHDAGDGLDGGGGFFHIMRGLKRYQARSQRDEHVLNLTVVA
ncbi:unnamed protein product, partial [Prorocentrum cordatum]